MDNYQNSPLTLDISEDNKKIIGSYWYDESDKSFEISYIDPPVFMDPFTVQKDFEPIYLVLKQVGGIWMIGRHPEFNGVFQESNDEVSIRIKEWLLERHEINLAIVYPHPNDNR